MRRQFFIKVIVLLIGLGLFFPRVFFAQQEGTLWEGRDVDEIEINCYLCRHKEIALDLIQSTFVTTSKSYTAEKLRNSMKLLWKEKVFEDITVAYREKDGKITLIFDLKEIPTVNKIFIAGHKDISRKDINEVMTHSKTNEPYDPVKIKADIEAIKALYVSKQYYSVQVSVQRIPLPNGQVNVKFDVVEKNRLSIRKVDISGNRFIPSSELQAIISTSASGLYSAIADLNIYIPDRFQKDLEYIRAYYQSKGFLNVKVDSRLQISPNKEYLDIVINIVEGPQYTMGIFNLNIQGDVMPSNIKLEDIKNRFPYSTGATINDAVKISQFSEWVKSLYTKAGYAKAEVLCDKPASVDSSFSLASYLALYNSLFLTPSSAWLLTVNFALSSALSFLLEPILHWECRVNPGAIYHIRFVTFKDLYESEKRTRRLLGVYDGQQFDSQKLARGIDKLKGLNLYKEVKYELVAVPGASNLVDILITVEAIEKLNPFTVGLSFSNVGLLLFQIKFITQNLFNSGGTLSVMANASTISQDIILEYGDNHFLGTNLYAKAQFFRRSMFYPWFSRTNYGGEITIGYPVTNFLTVGGSYRLAYENILRVSGSPYLANAYQPMWISQPGVFVSYAKPPTQENPWGFSANAHLAYSDKALGSGANYLELDGNFRLERPLWDGRIIPRIVGQANFVLPTRGSSVPFFARSLMGGPTNLTAYDMFAVGPKIMAPNSLEPNASFTPINIGGNVSLYGRLEVDVYLIKGFAAFSFFGEMGNAYNVEKGYCGIGRVAPTSDPCSSPSFSNLRYGAGFAIKVKSIQTQIGIGFPLNPEPGNRSFTIFLSPF